jgi:hypothetical protein
VEACVRQRLAYQRGALGLSDRAIDGLLGIRAFAVEPRLELLDLLRRFGPASYEYQGTPYPIIRDVLRWCARAGDVFYDLGAGHGRVVLYGAALSPAHFRGIEIVSERASAAETCRAALDLRNLEISADDARQADFSDGTIFFFFNPFFQDTLSSVGRRLRRLATRRHIRIASVGYSNDYFAARTWLSETTPGTRGDASVCGSSRLVDPPSNEPWRHGRVDATKKAQVMPIRPRRRQPSPDWPGCCACDGMIEDSSPHRTMP